MSGRPAAREPPGPGSSTCTTRAVGQTIQGQLVSGL